MVRAFNEENDALKNRFTSRASFSFGSYPTTTTTLGHIAASAWHWSGIPGG